MDEADEPAPGKAVLDEGVGPRATAWRPDPTEQRFEADAMLVGRPTPHSSTLALGKAVATARRSGLNFF
jgi:hypothetical protein